MTNKEILRFLKDKDMYSFYKPLIKVLYKNGITLEQFWNDMCLYHTYTFEKKFCDVRNAFMTIYKEQKPLSCIIDCILWRSTIHTLVYTKLFEEFGSCYADF